MPSAPKELNEKMNEYFGDPIAYEGPLKFLNDAGYKEEGGCWIPKPGIVFVTDMTEKEYACMVFLILEWDYGGLLPID